MTFKADISHFAKRTNSNLDEACRAIKISLFSAIIRDTRVDTGRLRGNWQTSTGSPVTTDTDRQSGLPKGQVPPEQDVEMDRNITGVGTKDYLTNGLPYAQVWEERDGMLSKNLARVSRIVREETK